MNFVAKKSSVLIIVHSSKVDAVKLIDHKTKKEVAISQKDLNNSS